jgi:hypothetical protein
MHSNGFSERGTISETPRHQQWLGFFKEHQVAPSVASSMSPSALPFAVPGGSVGRSECGSFHRHNGSSKRGIISDTFGWSKHGTFRRLTASPVVPTLAPSGASSITPSLAPSAAPSISPTTAPLSSPSLSPSAAPSVTPSVAPSMSPSAAPSVMPSIIPSVAVRSAEYCADCTWRTCKIEAHDKRASAQHGHHCQLDRPRTDRQWIKTRARTQRRTTRREDSFPLPAQDHIQTTNA